jgi:hypothetical protein
VSERHRNPAYLERRAAFISTLDTSVLLTKTPCVSSLAGDAPFASQLFSIDSMLSIVIDSVYAERYIRMFYTIYESIVRCQ